MTHFQYSITSSFAFGCSDARWNPNPFCSSSCKKNMNNTIALQYFTNSLKQTWHLSHKKNSQFPLYLCTSCFTGIHWMCFFLYHSHITGNDNSPNIIPSTSTWLGNSNSSGGGPGPAYSAVIVRFEVLKKQEVKHRKTGQKKIRTWWLLSWWEHGGYYHDENIVAIIMMAILTNVI